MLLVTPFTLTPVTLSKMLLYTVTLIFLIAFDSDGYVVYVSTVAVPATQASLVPFQYFE